MDFIRCNLCGSAELGLFFKCKDHFLDRSEQEFNVVKCRSCGLVYINPRPTDQWKRFQHNVPA